MKVLVTSTPGLGHILPLLPLSLELRERGHDVRWAVAAGSTEALEQAGFDLTVGGMPADERQKELARRRPDLLSLPEHERRAVAFSVLFGELAAPAMLDVVKPVVGDWQPDVVLHDAAELAAPLVAAWADVPSVCVGFGEIIPEPAVRRAAQVVAPLWRSLGLEPDEHAGSYRGLYVDIYPPSLRSLDMSHVARVQPWRPAEGTPASGDLVYVTFGTMLDDIDDAARAAIHASAAVAAEVLVTVGPTGNPDGVGPVPANVTVERFVPQAEVLPRCAAVVCHGGSGTVLAALAHGVPVVCLPRAADQFANAANVARVGAGVAVPPPAVDEAAVRDALAQVLASTEARQAARALAVEIAAMPATTRVAATIAAYAGR